MKKGEFVTLIGHSGCGKSTVLSMAAGLNKISSGGIVLDGHEVSGAGPDRAVVFQSPSLMPWLTARENVALGVDRVYPKASPAERRDIVEYYLHRVGLGDAMHRRAAELSNGMKQRVGIARAFALSPKLLLLDEPFGMLDSLTRWELQDVLMDVWARTKVTAICVTHDVDEAILLADRVVMMSNGPNATIGNIMEVDLPRPRSRKMLLSHPRLLRLSRRASRLPRSLRGRRQSRAGPSRRDQAQTRRAARCRPETAHRSSGMNSMTEKLVIIGNGMAPGRMLEHLLEKAPGRYEVTIFNAEPRVNYDRIMLSPVLSGEKDYEQIIIHGDGWYIKHGITLYKGHKVTEIDRVGQDGDVANTAMTVPYDKLVIATGSVPLIMPVPGNDLPGVLSYRDLDDVNAMLVAAQSRAKAVVIGGGLLGLEAAAGLDARDMDVTVAASDADADGAPARPGGRLHAAAGARSSAASRSSPRHHQGHPRRCARSKACELADGRDHPRRPW